MKKNTSKRKKPEMSSGSSQTLIGRRGFIKQMSATAAGLVSAPTVAALIGETAQAQPAHMGQSDESQAALDSLLSGFQHPPESARPRVWWHWMNGNVTWDGARKDMDWMKRVGIAGLQAFDAGAAVPQVVEKRLPYMSDGWKEVFRNTAAYADKLGLELSTASDPGWSETGGPWVPAADGMKKVAWSATRVSGGKPFNGKLPMPPKTSGMFQTSIEGGILGGRAPGQNPPELYVDQKVLAFQIPADAELPAPVMTTSAGPMSAASVAALSNGNLRSSGFELPSNPKIGGEAWVQWDYGKPVTIRGMAIASPLRGRIYSGLDSEGGGSPATKFRLDSSDDGLAWRDTGALVQLGMPQRTISVDSAQARYFRLVSITMPAPKPHPLGRWDRPTPPTPKTIKFTQLVLVSEPVVHSFEEKAGFTCNMQYYSLPSGTRGAEAAKPDSVIDLTSRMQPDGTLDWTPQSGEWMVVRIGYSLTGSMNRPAEKEATGLEVDKLDAAAVRRYMVHYLGMYRDATAGKMGAHGLRAMTFDSWEASFANWTPNILADFKRLRGYDPTPWLPALAGFVIDTPERSDAFLWDWRRTIMQLLKVNHYDQLTAMLHDIGIVRYGEAHEAVFATMGDGMEMKQSADFPMGAMWQERKPGPVETVYFTDLVESASVAHIYGQNVVACESMTGGPRFGSAPRDLKPTADAILISGVNRIVVHTSTHQPLDKGPGMTLGVGQYFTRLETWAEQAKPWMDYLARASFLLQQGQAVSDVAVFYGEAGPAVASYQSVLPNVPESYRFDYVNADVILNQLAFKDGAASTKTGMRYRVIYLGRGTSRVTLPVLRKLHSLVSDGAVVVGSRPQGSPSLSDNPDAVRSELDALWPGSAVAVVGRGRVFASDNLPAALDTMKLPPDFSYSKPAPDSHVMFIHRRLADGDIYFLSNRVDRAENIRASFRVSGGKPEVWDPATGLLKPISYQIANGRTSVTLPFDPFGSMCVVFRKAATQTRVVVPAEVELSTVEVTGPWNVQFQKDRGAPDQANFPSLMDFRESAVEGIRYFSGIATYSKVIDVSRPAGNHERIWLDLGDVYDLAEVWVNGKLAGTAWKPPFRVDITGLLTTGKNQFEIKVVDKWVNRLIGDVQPNITHKITFTAADGKIPKGMDPALYQRRLRMPYPANAPLVPAGLLGPVILKRIGLT